MSFRFRVLLMTMLIAVTATSATAWLTLRQASREFSASVTAGQDDIALITSTLAGHGGLGTWDGVQDRVRELAGRTGERIRVVTETGAVLADSDLLAGRAARDTTGPPTLVDPRPVVRLPEGDSVPRLAEDMMTAIVQYQRALRDASCLAAAGGQIRAERPLFGVPVLVAADPEQPASVSCRKQATKLRPAMTSGQMEGLLRPCVSGAGRSAECLQRVFIAQTTAFAPQPVQVYIGARDEEPPKLAGDSITLTAVVVAAAAVVVALLLSRRVLRPIAALTRASRRLASGDLGDRVRVRGSDELAELGRTFNQMADSLQQSEERQRRMVADVAHELRTPLANLRGYLEALKDGVLPATPEVLASLHEEALLQQRIVDDLQDLATAEAGAMTLHVVRLDLAELAETCRVSHAALTEGAGVTLRVDAPRPAYVQGDPDRLRQVLGNLIRNATAASRPGGTITLAVRSTDDAASISVADTGTGIRPEDLSHLFDRFWRADHARGRESGGSGLGLAIARQIVTNHSGTITAASRPEVGTTMTITLPAARQNG
ncbi:ATP-binding protein [Micromonospora sp. WMMA1949]|uniref:sensor histidine kinase n=1 Tax=unclassified Micromonospora TaxID=2617518 RepID=UPI0022B66FB9|nr:MULTISPECIES: ATP-binding protein [unclassified Micromonospora]MCZ7425748.1 ATP-binding protein [Micromonospora sp. WMMA1949]WBC10292.1 ATP-binding protein [Micromonospora sp. WMMA1947]